MLATVLATPSAATAAPADFVGIVAEDVFAGDHTYREGQLASQRSAGIGLTRQTFHWNQIETSPGFYDFSRYDAYVAALARLRLRVLAILFNPPEFRSSGRAGRSPRDGHYPPRRFEDMGDFAAVLVGRYGPRGSFWSEHPELPHVPIRSWQIWNEPNLEYYWPTGPSARSYAKLLKPTARAIQRVDPRAEIVTAGLPDTNKGIPLERFVTDLYKAGAASVFDTLAINPHAQSPAEVVRALKMVRTEMNDNRDRRTRIWVTELGWATGGPRGRLTFSERGQAEMIKRTFRTLARERSALKLRGVIYYAWRDAEPYDGRSDFWGLHTGLLDRDGRRKPGFGAFKRSATSLR